MGEKMKRIDLTELNIPQLSALKQQIDQEIEVLTNSIQNLQSAKNKYQESKNSVERQKTVANESQILVPLTGSMYLPGYVIDNDNFIVDIGTGYFVEKNQKSAADYFKRKVQFLSEQIEKYVKLTQEKVAIRETLLEQLQSRQQAFVNQQQQTASVNTPQLPQKS